MSDGTDTNQELVGPGMARQAEKNESTDKYF